MTPDQLKTAFLEDVPAGFLFDYVALVERAFPEAYKEEYRRRSWPEAHDALGVNRRAMIQESLREIVARYPGMVATVEHNRKKSQYYTEIRSGRVVMTSSCIPFPTAQLKPADFRNQLARTMQHTIPMILEDRVMPNGAVFAVLVHGPQGSEGDTPNWTDERPKLDWSQVGFAFAGFPTADSRSWVTRIELLKTYSRPPLAQDADVENIQDRVTPNLRTKPAKAEGKDETGG